MARRTINSPGVQIFERDLSLIAPQNVGTNIFITGYTHQGPIDEVLMISSEEELNNIYGTPTNSAERYFYHGVRELLNSPATIYTYRLPYGSGSGVGFGSQYSALAYPVNHVGFDAGGVLSAVSTNINQLSGTYVLGNPVHVSLSEDEYLDLTEGTLFDWSSTGSTRAALSSVESLANAGLIVVNKAQTTINSQFEGYYVAVADNTNINPASDYNAVLNAYSLTLSAKVTSSYTEIPRGTMQFSLSSTSNGGVQNSISQIMENLTDYDIDGREDDDVLNVGVFKLRKSIYATEAFKLDYVLDGAITGSIDYHRQALNPTGGPQVSMFLESLDENDRNVELFVNPYISNRFGNTSLNSSGIPNKKLRVLTRNLSGSSSTVSGIAAGAFSTLQTNLGFADNLYPVGAFSDQKITNKVIGEVPSKVTRALESVKNDEIYDIDIVVEAGLGTIFCAVEDGDLAYYDETAEFVNISALRTSRALDSTGEDIRGNYSAVFNVFENFCNLPSNTGGRGDAVFIADPIRHVLINGKNSKILRDRTKNFQTDVYWALRHQFELENTSYAATYANWCQVYDQFLGEKVWLPFSPVAATAYAKSDAAEFPWSAPAGYTRGLVSGNVLDLAITPNQKQRDELYKSNINPVLFSPSQGMAIFGQKTLSRKPSAFDRINVRRLFLALERPTKKASVFFVFEPNDEFTRTRFVNTIKPLFEYAKQNRGIYDYLIVCDERNNTPEVIDSNEMKCDIYIKPVRTAEYIIVQFTATRTDANFQELI
jgi:hypothetical protein